MVHANILFLLIILFFALAVLSAAFVKIPLLALISLGVSFVLFFIRIVRGDD
jgi:hypothetical protein